MYNAYLQFVYQLLQTAYMTYLRNLIIIFKQTNAYKWQLAIDYCKFLLIAFSEHRIGIKKRTNATFLGYHLEFVQLNTFTHLIDEIFIQECYSTTSKEKAFIIDIGGHIGLSAIYFHLHYPKATIHVYEANPITFQKLNKNITSNSFTNIYCFSLGVSTNNNHLYLHSGKTDLNFYLDAKKNTSVIPCVDILEIIKTKTDLLKIDTEGSEETLLKHLIEHKAAKNIQELLIETSSNTTLVPELTNVGFEVSKRASYNNSSTEEVILFKRLTQ